EPGSIAELYQSGRAGVESRLNVRGICCLRPGDPKHSMNIRVMSVIDRDLERARVFYFHHGGDPEIFIASADWMGRNLDRRVELMIPVEDSRARRRLLRMLESLFQDNIQASEILPDGGYRRLKPGPGEKRFRAQENFQRDARKAAKAREQERAMTFEPHVPQGS